MVAVGAAVAPPSSAALVITVARVARTISGLHAGRVCFWKRQRACVHSLLAWVESGDAVESTSWLRKLRVCTVRLLCDAGTRFISDAL